MFEKIPPTVLGRHTNYVLQSWDSKGSAWRTYRGIWATNDEDAVRLAEETVVFMSPELRKRTWNVVRVLACAGPELTQPEEQK